MVYETYLKDFADLLVKIDSKEVETLIETIVECYKNEKFVFIVGNGGSGANASHFSEDLGKGTLIDLEKQKRLKVMSLTDNTPAILAWANDTGYDRVFVEQLKNFAQPGCLLMAISGSGNSDNVLKAVEWANANGMKTFALTGYDGGKLRELCQQGLHVPSFDMGAVESAHLLLFHYVLHTLCERFKVVT